MALSCPTLGPQKTGHIAGIVTPLKEQACDERNEWCNARKAKMEQIPQI